MPLFPTQFAFQELINIACNSHYVVGVVVGQPDFTVFVNTDGVPGAIDRDDVPLSHARPPVAPKALGNLNDRPEVSSHGVGAGQAKNWTVTDHRATVPTQKRPIRVSEHKSQLGLRRRDSALR